MAFRLSADAVLLLHLAFILFALFGATLVLRFQASSRRARLAQYLGARHACPGLRCGALVVDYWQVCGFDGLALADQQGEVQNVFQLAGIARPAVVQQGLFGLLTEQRQG